MGLLDNVGGFIKDAGHDIAHAAGNGYKAASDAWNSAVEDAKAAANVVGTVVRDADAKKEQIGAWIDSKEQQLEHKVDDGRAWLREHGGVAGKLASDQIGLVEGVGTSLYDAGKGIVKLADGVNSLTNPLEWAANPGANIARLKSGVQTVETLGKIANLAQPTSWLADPKGNAQLAGALWHSASTSFHDDPAKFIGNAVGTVGTFFIPGGGEAAVAGDAGRAAAVLNDVGKVADVAKLADVADVAKVANTADAANGAGRLGGLAEDAGAAGRVVGRIEYGPLDALGRPTGVRATITQDMIGTGTAANPSITPPGWSGNGTLFNEARGHLLGRQLGGSGDMAENLVTLQQNPANTPTMRGFENLTRSTVEGGQVVQYSSTPIYNGTNLVPRGVTLSATGSEGFDLNVTILNPPGF
jgi:hypothetical protein